MKKETIDRIRKFTSDRDWEQFHTPANLAKSICIEAGELLECFQWSETGYDRDLDEDEIVNSKMDKNEAKYPAELARGSAAKYTELKGRK